MALSFEEFVEATGAEVCGDRLIVGVATERRFVGDMIAGTFSLNEEGKLLAEAIEADAAAAKESKVKAAVKAATTPKNAAPGAKEAEVKDAEPK